MYIEVEKCFYNNGLNFSCQRCSDCCRINPGFVFLSYNDLNNLCIATSLSKEDFIKQYCRIVDIGGFQRVSLTEKKNYDCIFWESGKGCVVYSFRPLQCQSYPFWSTNMDSFETWNSLTESCPGINNGKLNTKNDIDSWLNKKAMGGYILVENGKIIL